MKKILSIFIASIMLLSCLAIIPSALWIKYDEETPTIVCLDFLDFNEENTAWAEYDETDGWGYSDVDNGYYDDDNDDFLLKQAYVSTNKAFGRSKYTDDKVSWSLTDNNEVLHVEAISDSTIPGIPFCIDEEYSDVQVGREINGYTEYCKIRIRNYSSAGQFTIGFTTSNINNGLAFYSLTVTDVPVESNSSEWKTYIFSIPDYNVDTNYNDGLPKNADGIPYSRWGNRLGTFLVFPWGYNKTDGTGAYNTASMDIDYIVLGSEQYVTDYKSALEIKEDSVKSIEIKKAPDRDTFYVGELIDLAGLELEVTYKDDTKEIMNSANVVYNFDEETEKSTVTLKLGEAQATFDVKVVGISDVEIATTPDKEDDQELPTYDKVTLSKGFTPTGLTLKVKYNDGYERTVGLEALNYEYSFDTLGENAVTVNYHGFLAMFKVNVINVTGIKIEPLENIHYNEEITEDKLTITCVYSDGSEKSLSDANINATIDIACDTHVKGEATVNVNVSNQTYEIDCAGSTTATIVEPTELKLLTEGVKTEYNVDENFDTTNLVVLFGYSDGYDDVEVSTEDYRTRFDFSTPGEGKVVTFTDKIFGLSASLNANVSGQAVTQEPTTAQVTEAVTTTKADETTAKVDETTTAAPQTTTKTPETPSGNNGSATTIIIIVVVAVVVVAAVVVVLVVVKKKKA